MKRGLHATRNRTETPGMLGLVVAATVALSACAYSPEPGAYPEPPTPRVKASEILATLTAALPNPEGGFVGAERRRLGAFLDAYRDGGRGPLNAIVTAPDLSTAEQAAAALRVLARRRGVEEDAVVITTVAAATTGSRAQPGIALRYTDFVAVPPTCDAEVVMSNNPTGAVSPNLGCAIMRAFSANIAHPADLLQPTAEAAGDGPSRGRVIDMHRQGKATGVEASHNDDAKAAAISNMVGAK